MENAKLWLARKAVRSWARPDYEIKKGDVVIGRSRTATLLGEMEVVDVNWALLAVALRLKAGAILVWPVWSVRRV